MKAIASLFRGWIGGRKPHGRSRSDKAYVLDGAAVLGERAERVPAPPREIIAWIQRLTRFAQKERIPLQAVFIGAPLRKAPDGADFGGIEVFYAKDSAERVETITRLAQQLRRKGRTVTVITSDAVVEQRAHSLLCHVMRSQTFRKGLDLAMGGTAGGERPLQEPGVPGGERGASGDSDERRGGRRRRRRPRGGGRPGGPPPSPDQARQDAPPPASESSDRPSETPAPNPAPAPEAAPPKPAVSDEVRRLIDPVD